MFRLFRKIRYKLFTEGKFQNYTFYAIGEILLVVIGILIALEINNWHEHKQQIAQENEYYCRLLDDTRLDKEQFTELLSLANERLKSAEDLLKLLLEENVTKVATGALINRSIAAIYSDFQPNNSAYEDLKSGANLNIISDKSIITAINKYFNKIEELKSIIMVNGQHAVDILFAHKNNFATGRIQAHIIDGRFENEINVDLKSLITIDRKEMLAENMQKRLFNESLEYITVNARQIELYNRLFEENQVLDNLLLQKCPQG